MHPNIHADIHTMHMTHPFIDSVLAHVAETNTYMHINIYIHMHTHADDASAQRQRSRILLEALGFSAATGEGHAGGELILYIRA
jgi:hypothetical protein